MKLIKLLGITSLVLLALGALTATAASAHAWENKKAPITEPHNVIGTATLSFEDKWRADKFTCKITSKATVKPGAIGEITGIASKTGAKEIPCEAHESPGCSTVTIEAKFLPWKTELATIGGELRDTIKPAGEFLTPQWTVRCTGTEGKITETCEASPNTALKNYSAGVEAIYDAKSPATNCSAGPAGTFTTKGTEDITFANGETGLGVS